MNRTRNFSSCHRVAAGVSTALRSSRRKNNSARAWRGHDGAPLPDAPSPPAAQPETAPDAFATRTAMPSA
eukprot:scaffold19956_cov101-Isochrysis_galbana.AAC.1